MKWFKDGMKRSKAFAISSAVYGVCISTVFSILAGKLVVSYIWFILAGLQMFFYYEYKREKKREGIQAMGITKQVYEKLDEFLKDKNVVKKAANFDKNVTEDIAIIFLLGEDEDICTLNAEFRTIVEKEMMLARAYIGIMNNEDVFEESCRELGLSVIE